MVDYAYRGGREQGWEILRRGRCVLRLGPGYVAVESRLCGICATDLARRHLPFPLPQITGHEVVGRYQGQRVVVEINASHRARGLAAACPYCARGLDSHCPQRLTLGIDRLPGGFAPWILAPVAALHTLPAGVSDEMAVLVEPLAAAIQALRATPPRHGQRIAVLGPRRLGMLLLVALLDYREHRQQDFELTALARHPELRQAALALGADRAMAPENAPAAAFQHVFDTTGSVAGLARALELASETVHLKSTHGQTAFGLSQLTTLVIDEIALLPAHGERRNPAWADDTGGEIYVSPAVPAAQVAAWRGRHPRTSWCQAHPDDASPTTPLGRFDAALVDGRAAVDAVLRAGLVRPRGVLHWLQPAGDDALARALARGVALHSSRCGPFGEAIALLARAGERARRLADELISHRFDSTHIDQAFAMAADSRQARKVVVRPVCAKGPVADSKKASRRR